MTVGSLAFRFDGRVVDVTTPCLLSPWFFLYFWAFLGKHKTHTYYVFKTWAASEVFSNFCRFYFIFRDLLFYLFTHFFSQIGHISYTSCSLLLKIGYLNSRNQFFSSFRSCCWLWKDTFTDWLKVILQRLFLFLINFLVRIPEIQKSPFKEKAPLSKQSLVCRFAVSFGLYSRI